MASRTISENVLQAHTKVMELHTRVLACHCECLGMNAENMLAACAGGSPPYSDKHYIQVMQRYRLVNEKGNSII